MKQLEVTIMGQSYILACPPGRETLLLEAVGSVDREMCTIRDAGKVKARERIAVLAALNLAYELANASNKPPVVAEPVAPVLDRRNGDDLAVMPDLARLLERLDAALGDDGRLL
ncbi:MAG: cell division protein ZapA [Burkholderiales bacterium]|nr:cell division protein ZapA [Burkholderiales bacterium]